MRHLRGLLISVGATCICLLLLEGGCRIWIKPRQHMALVYGGKLTEALACRRMDPLLGASFTPNCSTRWTRSFGDQLIFDVPFTTDSYGRRAVSRGLGKERERLALFFGGSFTLGAGVADDETLPSDFAAADARYDVYNFGGSAYGPQHLLARLSETDIVGSVEKVKGRKILVYVFSGSDVAIASGSPLVESFMQDFPYYTFNAEHQLVHKGNFRDGRPADSRLYEMLVHGIYSLSSHSRAMQVLLPALLQFNTAWSFELTEVILQESARWLEKKFKSRDFVVLIYPLKNDRMSARLIPYLDHAGLRYLDYSNLFKSKDNQREYELVDGHPTALAHRLVAERLARDLKALFR